MSVTAELPQGTLDLLILEAVSLGPLRLKEETAYWPRFSEAIGFALEAMPEDV